MSGIGWAVKRDRDGRDIPDCWLTRGGYTVARMRLTDAERQRNQYRERLDRAGLLHRPRQDNNRRWPGGSHMTLD